MLRFIRTTPDRGFRVNFSPSLLLFVGLLIFSFASWGPASLAQEIEEGIFFSTEEDFVTQGPEPADGNPIISDGDLLNSRGRIYLRNYELLQPFKVQNDLGLDAAEVLDVEEKVVAFSTELDDPFGSFTAGDLLATNGAIIPNYALLASFQISRRLDLGLDAVHFQGERDGVIQFLDLARRRGRDFWLQQPQMLANELKERGIDIWFSTEGTMQGTGRPGFLDGDLLSAASGTIVLSNENALPGTVPAGIPNRGVDFGMDAATMLREQIEGAELILFSTEINGLGFSPSFTDGDGLLKGNGVMFKNGDLVGSFEPKTRDLGLDALSALPYREKVCRFTKIGGVPVVPALWDETEGYADPDGSGRKDHAFGRWVSIRAELGPDAIQHRVLYRPERGTDSPILMPPSLNWQVYCHGTPIPVSVTGDGWFSTGYWRYLKNDCGNGDLILVNWDTTASSVPDGKYILTLQTKDASGRVTTCEERAVQVDNTRPELSLTEANECQSYDKGDLPLKIEGAIFDDHFSRYELRVDAFWIPSYWGHLAESGDYYDGWPFFEQGTMGYPAPMPLGSVDIPPSLWGEEEEGGRYTVFLRAWDRSILGRFWPKTDVVADAYWTGNYYHVLTNFEFYP